MINALNFCHIEKVRPGINVLFYAEHDGDQIVMHQVTMADAGSIDQKISMPAEQFEKLWPDQITFPQAAEYLLSVLQEVGLKPLVGKPKPAVPVGSTHEERVALALALTWSLENIEVEEVKGIMERLAADGYEIRRIGDWPGLRDVAQKVIEAEEHFREQMHPDWEGDPLTDAVASLRRELAAHPTPSTPVSSVDWNNPEDPAVKLFVSYDVEAYAEYYEFVGNDGEYSPNDKEKALIGDAVRKVICDLHDQLQKIIPATPAHSTQEDGQ